MPKRTNTTSVVPWSDEQLHILEYAEYLDDPFMVFARAGTGKTTIGLGMLSLLRGTIWFCAYGKRIADEISHKVKLPKWRIDLDRTRTGTVHSRGRAILAKRFPVKQVNKTKVYDLVQSEALKNATYRYNAWRIWKLVGLAKQSGAGVLFPITDIASWYAIIDHFGMDLTTTGKPPNWDAIIAAAQDVYMTSLEMCIEGNIDFDDMLLAPLYYELPMPRYDNIVIDEYQDISPLRFKLITSCLAKNGRVIALGDEFQAIFGFTGADANASETIRQFTGGECLPLTISRRCTKAAITRAQALVPDIRAAEDAIDGVDVHAHLAEDPTGATQALTPWDIHKQKPFNANDVILCRNNRPLATLAFSMLRQHIPCYVEGREDGMGLTGLIKTLCKDSLKPITDLDSLAAKVSDWRDERVWFFQARKQNFKAAYVNDQAETIIYLSQVVKADGSYSVHELIRVIDSMFKDTYEDGVSKCITLSTIHKAKGKEWDRVFLLGRNKYMPSQFARQDWEQQQERNLEYVSYTRNRKEFIDVFDNAKR